MIDNWRRFSFLSPADAGLFLRLKKRTRVIAISPSVGDRTANFHATQLVVLKAARPLRPKPVCPTPQPCIYKFFAPFPSRQKTSFSLFSIPFAAPTTRAKSGGYARYRIP